MTHTHTQTHTDTHRHTHTKAYGGICLQWYQLDTSGARTLQVKPSDMLLQAIGDRRGVCVCVVV